jgi:hypothetical protein
MAKSVIQFNATAFIKALGKELKVANQNIRDEMWDAITDKMRDLPFKPNAVKLAGGGITSDIARRSALLKSMVDTRANWITETHLRSTITAMANNFKESHIGLYYEYGTGQKQDLEGFKYESLGDPNLPFRVPNTGAPIVTRSWRRGMGGAWRDAGGNLRITASPRAGEPTKPGSAAEARFRNYIGEDVQAYHWFREAVNSPALKRRVNVHFGKAIKNIQKIFTSFFVLSNFTLGKD